MIADLSAGACHEMADVTFAEHDPFFPVGSGPGHYDDARAICGPCPVIDLCRADVMANEPATQRFGMWAGMTPDERTALYRSVKRNPQKRDSVGFVLRDSHELPPEEHAARKRAYDAGLTDAELGQRFGISRQSAGGWRYRLGLPPNSVSPPASNLRYQAVNQIRAELHAKGWTDVQIAKATGCTRDAVRNWRTRNNLPTNEQAVS